MKTKKELDALPKGSRSAEQKRSQLTEDELQQTAWRTEEDRREPMPDNAEESGTRRLQNDSP